MVNLEERVEQHFDVALHIETFLGHEAPALGLELLEVVEERVSMLQQGFRIRILIDENPIIEALAAHADEGARCHVQSGEVALVAQVDEFPIECVGPTVVAADKTFRLAACGLDQGPATVSTGVVERTHLVVLAADDENGRAGLFP